MEEVPYCCSRLSATYQGHANIKIADLDLIGVFADDIGVFVDDKSSFNSPFHEISASWRECSLLLCAVKHSV